MVRTRHCWRPALLMVFLLLVPPSLSDPTEMKFPGTSAEAETHILIRCSWGESFSDPSVSDSCSPDFCHKIQSLHAYGTYRFAEVVFSVKNATKNAKKVTEGRLFHSQAQCIYLRNFHHPHFDQLERNRLKAGTSSSPLFERVCACVYPSFYDSCSQQIEWEFMGDSTMDRLKKDIKEGCTGLLAVLNVSRNMPESSGIEASKPPTVYILNEGTLHLLYLIHAQEQDVAMKNGSMLRKSILSAEDYVGYVAKLLCSETVKHPGAILVYMESNVVCPMVYDNSYCDSWRYMIEQINASEVVEAANRRGVDNVAALGFSLDNYGSALASFLAKQLILNEFPHILILPHTTHYPASCELTKDGRHIDKGRFRISKARVLWAIIKHALDSRENIPYHSTP